MKANEVHLLMKESQEISLWLYLFIYLFFFFFQPITQGVVSIKAWAWSLLKPLSTRSVTFNIDPQSSVSSHVTE